jgi:hypothetical protein
MLKSFFLIIFFLVTSTHLLHAQRSEKSILLETLLKKVVPKVITTQNVLGLPTAVVTEVGINISMALFDRYMQYNDYIKESKDKIHDLDEKQKNLFNQMDQNQKQIMQTFNDTFVKLNEIQQDVKEIKQDVKEIKQDIQDIKQDMTQIKQDIQEIKSNTDPEKDLLSAIENLKEFFLKYKHPIAAEKEANAIQDLNKIKSEFEALRFKFTNRKDLKVMTWMSLSTIHKILGQEELYFKYLMWILEIPLSSKIHEFILPKLDSEIRAEQYKSQINPNHLKQKELQQVYKNTIALEDSFKISDQYLLEIQEDIKSILKNRYHKDSQQYQEMLKAQENSNKHTEANANEILRSLLDQIK